LFFSSRRRHTKSKRDWISDVCSSDLYEEQHDGQTIQSTIKLGHDEALIMRSGAVKMRFPLALGETRNGQYNNEHMALPLIVKTKKLQYEENEQSGSFIVQYELHADGSLLG